MATNPMQRQARNSFLLGMAVTLIIAGIIVALLFMQIKNLNETLQTERAGSVSVYVLNRDVTSGQVLTEDMFSLVTVKSSGVPVDATSDITGLISSYSLCDKSGNNIYTDTDGSLYMQTNDTRTTVYRDETTGNYYTQATNGTRTYIETTQKELIAKVDMRANTVIASSYIARSDELDTDDVRQQEYNMVVLPIDLMTGEYIDIRLQLPGGQDFIVVSKKMVTIPQVNGQYLSDTIQVKMAEEEILTMANAIVEAYKIDGAKLYATKYTEAGLQDGATPTYVVNEEVANLIEADPNIVSEAMAALSERYNANNGQLTNIRNQYINNALSTYGDEEALPDKVEESTTSTQESRQEYLQSLTATGTTTTTTTTTNTTTNTTGQ